MFMFLFFDRNGRSITELENIFTIWYLKPYMPVIVFETATDDGDPTYFV